MKLVFNILALVKGDRNFHATEEEINKTTMTDTYEHEERPFYGRETCMCLKQ